MLIHGPIVPLSELSPGEWFVLMRRGLPDCEDSLEPTDTPMKLDSIDEQWYTAKFIWRGHWYPQKLSGNQLVRRCDVTR